VPDMMFYVVTSMEPVCPVKDAPSHIGKKVYTL